jgi:hypothetical protein
MSLSASLVREPILADSFTQQKPFPFLVATQTLPQRISIDASGRRIM